MRTTYASAADHARLVAYKSSLDDRYHVPVNIREMMFARILNWKFRVNASWRDVKMVVDNLGVGDKDTVHGIHARLVVLLKEKE
jgi:hypothetical protein